MGLNDHELDWFIKETEDFPAGCSYTVNDKKEKNWYFNSNQMFREAKTGHIPICKCKEPEGNLYIDIQKIKEFFGRL